MRSRRPESTELLRSINLQQSNSEVSAVISPGARTQNWAAVVKGHVDFNVYNVQVVELGPAGVLPSEIGKQMQAFNLAEPFLQQGQLSSGTYVIMVRVGGKNVFYAPA